MHITRITKAILPCLIAVATGLHCLLCRPMLVGMGDGAMGIMVGTMVASAPDLPLALVLGYLIGMHVAHDMLIQAIQ